MSALNQQPSSTVGDRIWMCLAGDIASGAISATLISPIIAIIDRATAEKASINQPLLQGLRRNTISAVFHPGKFLISRPFGFVWLLYAATYSVANSSETLSHEFSRKAAGAITFVFTSLVNVPLGIWKDINYARMFGAPPSLTQKKFSKLHLKTPSSVTTTFLLRDGITILGSFTLVPVLTAAIPDSVTNSPHAKGAISQMTMPVVSQFAASPLHLLGLNYYNRRESVTLRERAREILRDLPAVTLLRCVRIVPAFGTGCVINTDLRALLHGSG